jgi:hypothetical protein
MIAGRGRNRGKPPRHAHGTGEPEPPVQEFPPSSQVKEIMAYVVDGQYGSGTWQEKSQVMHITGDVIHIGVHVPQSQHIREETGTGPEFILDQGDALYSQFPGNRLKQGLNTERAWPWLAVDMDNLHQFVS